MEKKKEDIVPPNESECYATEKKKENKLPPNEGDLLLLIIDKWKGNLISFYRCDTEEIREDRRKMLIEVAKKTNATDHVGFYNGIFKNGVAKLQEEMTYIPNDIDEFFGVVTGMM